MIRQVRVENYKSILKLVLDIGRFNVIIGANGSGKTNILEAIALASAAAQNKLDNEFLISRGIRITETRFMYSAFDKNTTSGEAIQISVERENNVKFACELSADETTSYPKWRQRNLDPDLEPFVQIWRTIHSRSEDFPFSSEKGEQIIRMQAKAMADLLSRTSSLLDFLIYAPENSALRTFQAEGQILPLGIKGEGLFAHLKALSSEAHRERLEKIKERLTLIDWFESFVIPEDLSPGERSIRIRDRYLTERALFDQRSANEGFLFLLFYLTLFISPETPAFFSIDNIDTSLNPKLCIALIKELVKLAKEYDKQVILTTHNPAVLDGLDLHDDEQRLLVADRNKDGYTRVRRVEAPKPRPGQPPVSLSEAFVRGFIGGLPNNF